MIIIRGRNYYPQDIEKCAADAHSSIRAGCVAAFALTENQQEQVVVLAEVRKQQVSSKVIDAIQESIFANLGLTAAAIVLVKSGSLPKTSSGKLQRFACKRDFENDRLSIVKHSGKHNVANETEIILQMLSSMSGSTTQQTILAHYLAEQLDVDVNSADLIINTLHEDPDAFPTTISKELRELLPINWQQLSINQLSASIVKRIPPLLST